MIARKERKKRRKNRKKKKYEKSVLEKLYTLRKQKQKYVN